MLRLLGVMFALMIMFAPGQAHAVCSSPSGNAGAVYYNTTEKIFQYCNDTIWKRMHVDPGTGSGGCANPTLIEGQLVYNADHRILQGCAGNVYRPMSPVGGFSERWTDIASGPNHSCGVRSDRRAFCWGMNNSGQLGDGTTTPRALPVEVNGSLQWSRVTVGADFSCGITTTGAAYCWGRGNRNQLGNGGSSDSSSPVLVSGGHSWTQISSGAAHTCGINTSNNLLCWGYGLTGRLGDNATSNNTTPNTVTDVGGEAGNPDTWISVTAGYDHSCGVMTSGNAYCWGNPANGGLGNGSTAGTYNTPQAVSGGFTWISIDAGTNLTCAVRSTGAGYCWGADSQGELGNGGGDTDVSTPSAISGGASWLSLNAGEYAACGIQTNNNVYCWGGVTTGLLGNGTTDRNQTTPVQTTNITTGNYNRVSVGTHHACAVQSDGDLFCWGSSRYGGTGNNTVNIVPTPSALFPKANWRSIDITRYVACGLRDDQSLMCWGNNGNGEAGIGVTGEHLSSPTTVVDAGPWIQVSTGGYHACGLKSDQVMWCWGMGADGRTALGNTSYTNTPTQSGNIRWKHISSGNAFGCGLVLDSDNVTGGNQNENEIFCWGEDTDGQQGNGAGATADQLSPGVISVAGPWKTVEAGWRHACAIRTDDTLWCWGYDGSNQLGNGAATTSVETPTQVGVATWMSISLGQSHTCGLQTDGSAWCTGYGGDGGIGNGAFSNVNVFTAVSGGHVFSALSAGNHFNCAIRASDNRLMCWGFNFYGQSVTGDFYSVATPTLASSTLEWTQVSAGEQAACGMTIGGFGWCWGENMYGQSGSAKWNLYTSPTQAGCGAPAGMPGQLVYNSSNNLLQYCNGAGWVPLGFGSGYDQPTLPTSGLVGYWSFDEGSGTTANDSSGNGNTGTLTNGPTWVAGRVGAYALNFDGNNDHVNAGSGSTLDNLTAMTVCAWVYPTGGGSGSFPGIVDKSTDGYNSWNFYLLTPGTGYGYYSNNGAYREESGAITANQWQHLCATWNGGSTASTSIDVFRNGVSVISGSSTVNGSSMFNDAANNLVIGIFGDMADAFQGRIDEVRIYNRVLTLPEIQALANQ